MTAYVPAFNFVVSILTVPFSIAYSLPLIVTIATVSFVTLIVKLSPTYMIPVWFIVTFTFESYLIILNLTVEVFAKYLYVSLIVAVTV